MGDDREADLVAYRAAIAAMPPLLRAVFTMSRDAGKSYREIAGWLELDMETVELAMTYAIAIVAQTVRDQVPSPAKVPRYRLPASLAAAEATLFGCYQEYLARQWRGRTFDDWLHHIGPAPQPLLARWLGR